MKGRLAMVAGLGLILAGLRVGWQRWQFVSTATQARGTVVMLEPPRIEFLAGADGLMTFEQRGPFVGYERDEVVTVLFADDAPVATASVDDFMALWSLTAVLLSMGVSLVLLAPRFHD